MKLKDLVKLKPIIEAIEQGKQIQSKNSDGSGWSDVDMSRISAFTIVIGFDDIMDNFRIKPEPREWFIAVDVGSGKTVGAGQSYIVMEERYLRTCKIIKVREVIE